MTDHGFIDLTEMLEARAERALTDAQLERAVGPGTFDDVLRQVVEAMKDAFCMGRESKP